jgi:hypothetical protein
MASCCGCQVHGPPPRAVVSQELKSINISGSFAERKLEECEKLRNLAPGGIVIRVVAQFTIAVHFVDEHWQ